MKREISDPSHTNIPSVYFGGLMLENASNLASLSDIGIPIDPFKTLNAFVKRLKDYLLPSLLSGLQHQNGCHFDDSSLTGNVLRKNPPEDG